MPCTSGCSTSNSEPGPGPGRFQFLAWCRQRRRSGRSLPGIGGVQHQNPDSGQPARRMKASSGARSFKDCSRTESGAVPFTRWPPWCFPKRRGREWVYPRCRASSSCKGAPCSRFSTVRRPVCGSTGWNSAPPGSLPFRPAVWPWSPAPEWTGRQPGWRAATCTSGTGADTMDWRAILVVQVACQQLRIPQNNKFTNEVFQFAHVPRPVVVHHCLSQLGGKHRIGPVRRGVLLHQEFGQRNDVFAAFAKRRQHGC